MLGTKNMNHKNFYENEDDYEYYYEDTDEYEEYETDEYEDEVEDLKEELSEGEDEEYNPFTKENLYKLDKDEQLVILEDLGLTKSEIKKLKYEGDRVEKIMELVELAE